MKKNEKHEYVILGLVLAIFAVFIGVSAYKIKTHNIETLEHNAKVTEAVENAYKVIEKMPPSKSFSSDLIDGYQLNFDDAKMVTIINEKSINKCSYSYQQENSFVIYDLCETTLPTIGTLARAPYFIKEIKYLYISKNNNWFLLTNTASSTIINNDKYANRITRVWPTNSDIAFSGQQIELIDEERAKGLLMAAPEIYNQYFKVIAY